MRASIAVLGCLLVCLGTVGPAVAVEPAASTTVETSAAAGANTTVETNAAAGANGSRGTPRWNATGVVAETVSVDRAGTTATVRFTRRYRVPWGLADFAVSVSDRYGAAVVDRSGFERRGDRWVWDGTTMTPRLVVERRYPTDREALGSWNVRLTPAWTLVTKPAERVQTRAQPDGNYTDATVEREWRVDGRGVVGSRGIALGAVRTLSERVDNATVRLVVPNRSAPAVAPAEALRVLAATERRLRGDRSGDATVFVVPTGNTGPIDLPPGMANGRDAWVFASADRATYLHEYVHVEQEFRSGTRMAWFGEASASYLTRYLSMTYGLSGVFPFEVFATLVDRRGGTAGDAVLTRPETWGHYTEYRAGRTLLAALDARIRERTDGRRSFLDVFARLNRNSDLANASQWTRQVHTHASYRELRTVVAALAGDATARWLDEHVTTPARPSVRATRDTYEFGLAYFEDHPDARPTYDVDRGSNVTVPVRLDATRTATLRIATDRGRVNVSVHDADGDGRADVEFVPASRAGGEPAVRAADPHDWAVAWGLALDAPLSPGRHELRLSTSDDSPRFPDSRATLRIDGTSNGPIRNASTGPAPEPMRSSP